MWRKACCCSAHLCLSTNVPRRAPLTFAHSRIQTSAFPVNVVVYSSALTARILAMSWARRVQPAILALAIQTCIELFRPLPARSGAIPRPHLFRIPSRTLQLVTLNVFMRIRNATKMKQTFARARTQPSSSCADT